MLLFIRIDKIRFTLYCTYSGGEVATCALAIVYEKFLPQKFFKFQEVVPMFNRFLGFMFILLALMGAITFSTGPVEAKTYTWMNASHDKESPVDLNAQGTVNRAQNVAIKAINGDVKTLKIMSINRKRDTDTLKDDVGNLQTKVANLAEKANSLPGWAYFLFLLVILALILGFSGWNSANNMARILRRNKCSSFEKHDAAIKAAEEKRKAEEAERLEKEKATRAKPKEKLPAPRRELDPEVERIAAAEGDEPAPPAPHTR